MFVICMDYSFMPATIIHLIVDKKYSPDAALALAKEEGVTGETSICRVTLYYHRQHQL